MTRSRIKHESDDSNDQVAPLATPITMRDSIYTVPNGSASINPSFAANEPASYSSNTIANEDVDMQGGPSSSGTETTGNALQELASHSRSLIQLIQALTALNIDATIPSWPKFVVVGNQSAGKSSIVEAICDITVPRDEGTCTRCPFLITTSASSSSEPAFSCRVSLHLTYAYSPKAVAGSNPTKFDHWVKLPKPEAIEFDTVYDKAQVETVLRRAQLAILSSRPDQVDSRGSSTIKDVTLQFSPNVVSIEIHGPGLPELSFYDLPGAINVVDGDDSLVPFVERLIKLYLTDEQALVLLACSADQDIENSTAFKFVRQCGAEGRCMGVLTKADLAPPSKYGLFELVLQRIKFPLAKGWFVTKQLSQDKLAAGDVTHTHARRLEQEYFAREPWSTTFSPFADRLGTLNLRTALSQYLTTHILDELPGIITRVEDRLLQIAQTLLQFPEAPASATYEVISEMHRLIDTTTHHLTGDGGRNDFRTEYKTLLKDAARRFRDARPRIMLGTPGYIRPSIPLDESDNDVPGAATPAKIRKGNNGLPVRTVSQTPTPRSSRIKKEPTMDIPKGTLTLDELRELYDRGSGSGIPDQLHPKVTEQVVLMMMGSWDTIVAYLARDIKTHVLRLLTTTVVDEVLVKRQKTQLYTQSKQVVSRLFQALWIEQEARIRYVLQCETHKPVTYASDQLRKLQAAIETKLQHDRLTNLIDEHYDRLEADGQKVPVGTDREKKRAELQSKLGGQADEYNRELGAIARLLAYYDLASARMLDTIAVHLEFGLINSLPGRLRDGLRTELRITEEQHCLQLLAEDPARERVRLSLLEEQKKLQDALGRLKAVLPTKGTVA
ncbi:hypothetical protein BAUCODRAFT_119274 [Baudoinia panamericana UAMH 10762]|uniref:GED domain-containing protein n=1 Tax=Baudoinia panamericana (strain UAMH 10762) TaxID=717646 RepID=M2NJV3_BAUPA|nr:uncharacterized protein BAUCODRAFT_119274 [Baudoinia panamericana UAMH 10762]EMC99704.1 hypothetical protein BAUCODRAFT_119274 [Baudoinia panamericana UAMH 10762]